MKLYILKNGQILGPYSEEDVQAQLTAGTISMGDSFAIEGAAAWKSLSEMPLGRTAVPVPLGPPSRVYQADPHAAQSSAGNATSTLAIAALITGIIGVVCGVSSLAAVVLGHLALSEIKRNPAMKGREMALTGLVFGYVILGLSLIAIIGLIFFNAAAVSMKHSFIHTPPPH